MLEKGLEGGEPYKQIAALDAILQIDPDKGLAFAELTNENVDVRRNRVLNAWKNFNFNCI